MNNIAISVVNLGKTYHLYDKPVDRLKEALHPFRKVYHSDFNALNDINFEIKKGTATAIIGTNGSGKSTLLKILSGVLEPTFGEVCISGRVAAILELGTGFNNELTGLENIYFYGALQGFTKEEMQGKEESILKFADIGNFIHQPIKTYSSGMLARLAFSVSINIDAEILIIDEALAVGDIFFRQKCYKKLSSMLESVVTILLVTHAMNDVEQFCSEALLLNQGKQVFCGGAREAVKLYYIHRQQVDTTIEKLQDVDVTTKKTQSIVSKTDTCSSDYFWPSLDSFVSMKDRNQVGGGKLKLASYAICDDGGNATSRFSQSDTAVFYYELEVYSDVDVIVAGLEIINDKGVTVHCKSTLEYDPEIPFSLRAGQRIRFKHSISLNLAVGEYSFSLGIGELSNDDFRMRTYFSNEELDAKMVKLCIVPSVSAFTIGFREHIGKTTQLTHYGVADLPGDCQVYF